MKKLLCVFLVVLTLVLGLSACGSKAPKISFVVDGEVYKTIETSGEEYLLFPQNPTKDGYVFEGWFLDEGIWSEPIDGYFLLNDKLTQDISVYAKFQVDPSAPQNPSNPQNPSGEQNPSNPENPDDSSSTHTHSYEKDVTPPTCTEKGYTTYTCACGHSYVGDNTDKIACEPSDWIISSESSCLTSGEKYKQCTMCGKELERMTSETGSHSYDENNECTVCHDILQSVGLSFTWDSDTQGYAVSQGTATDKNIAIPYKYNDKYVTAIATKGFYESTLESVYIPKTVKVIGVNAFYGCNKLTKIDIPEGVTELKGRAFYSCRYLVDVTLPDSLVTIGEEVFSWCSGLKSLVIPKNTVNMGSSLSARFAFKEGISLENISVASGNPKYHSTGNNIIETAEKKLVYGIQGCIIPTDGSVTAIGAYAFQESRNLGKFTIPSVITTIGTNAFRSAAITELVIEEGVKEIGDQAFRGCGQMTGTVTIPDSVLSLDSWAFGECFKIENVIIGSGLTKIGGNAFYGCKKLAEITIGKNVKEIGSYAFYNCTSLANAYFVCKTPWAIYEDSYYTKQVDVAYVNDSAKAAKSLSYEGWERCYYYWKRGD